ncbi:hypothetical protein QCA50_001625 [Cerrena zonata]|uniref:Uncharacterized protein n=1 Tax=Cerrena zonata TaxID=2478898 RepID=A0AAW0GRH1_9APHY
MSKRQRPSSPIPVPPETRVEDESSEAYEPSSKRRRYFAPAASGDHQSPPAGEEYDSEDSEAREGYTDAGGRRGYSAGRREWQAKAGVYKDANSLLHDLHAEQRHRILFSTPSMASPGAISTPHLYTYPISPNFESKLGPSAPTMPAYNAVQTEMMEAATVTHQYENSNRLLKSLFLNRRQGHPNSDQSSSLQS